MIPVIECCRGTEDDFLTASYYYLGSAKAMEQNMVVEMVQNSRDQGIKTSTIIGDDDSTTISKLRQVIDPSIQKRSDRTHMKKNLGNRLYALQKQHKTLSTKVIRYIQKCWNYMIAQNLNNIDGITTGLDALSKHPFGDHSSCEDWCDHIKDPSKKYKSLPHGKCLNDKGLQSSLAGLFNGYKEHCAKLSEMGSTQANEALNMTIASKAPKRYHFSGSASLSYRVAAGVAQKNIGHSYVTKVRYKHTMLLYSRRQLNIWIIFHIIITLFNAFSFACLPFSIKSIYLSTEIGQQESRFVSWNTHRETGNPSRPAAQEKKGHCLHKKSKKEKN
jgi:hypothetical protein